METKQIVIRGARVHNLKNINLTLPKNQLICFSGVSGSGKSSLAFDTLYAEGQRRYVESLSPYARQFLGQIEKPDVDQITGLAPAISIEQKAGGRNPRSTVGTITEIYDYLRVLFARIGTPHCMHCGQEIGAQSREQIVAQILSLAEGTRLYILAPLIQGRRGEYLDLFEEMQRQGFIRARVNGRILDLTEDPHLDRNMRHTIEMVIDRLVLREGIRPRLAEAVEGAIQLGQGTVLVQVVEGPEYLFSARYACAQCNMSYQEPTPQLFSFNSPQGMCPRCSGLGTCYELDPERIVPDPARSIDEGAIFPLGRVTNRWKRHYLEGVAAHLDFTLDTPWQELTEKQRRALLYGLGTERIVFTFRNARGDEWSHRDTFRGIIPELEKRYNHLRSERIKQQLEPFMRIGPCPQCQSARLRPEALAVTVGGKSIAAVCALSVEEAFAFFQDLELTPLQHQIADEALKEIRARLDFLMNVGLTYLTLDRTAPTLSGGEAQRIRLASQIGRGLVGVMYVLDEPSIGLHHRDNRRLLDTLCRLRDIGNTVIVVEHDEETMRSADFLVDFGPGPGVKGGEIVATGPIESLMSNTRSITGKYLTGERVIPVPKKRRAARQGWLEILGARHNNLKDIDIAIPLGLFTCVTGVSGSGKSSLVNDILFRALNRRLHGSNSPVGAHRRVRGMEYLDKVINIDQSPIGRTPRSNPATYTGVLDPIRRLFADLPESKRRGYKPGRFSFNVKGGRCQACQGNGANRVEMDFLPDVWVTCPICEGKRFNRETLEVRYKGHSIADVLAMDVQQALDFFRPIPAISRILKTLHEVGLGYIKLGQPAPTLSGGEAQRVKLARELCKRPTGRTLYILDEPTTGLHFADIQQLLEVLHRFADNGNSVVVIEHNLDVIKTADYLIDLGPEGGEEGGYLVAAGTPEEVIEQNNSYTGLALRDLLRAKSPVTATWRPRSGLYDTAMAEGGDGHIREIRVVGAQEHNLKNLTCSIPRDRLTVFSGISGSGKTSLALDTIFAEGQRRYVESLSAYARQFLQQMQKPRVDHLTGLSPAISIDQKSAGRNPRSTVGTITEIYDYLRALFALLGIPHCPRCGVEIGAQTSTQIIDRIQALSEESQVLLLAPVQPGPVEDYPSLLERARKSGYVRVRVDGRIYRLDEEIPLDRRSRHQMAIVVDRLIIKPGLGGRLADSVETALEVSGGWIEVLVEAPRPAHLRFSQQFACPKCGQSYPPPTPQSFSFNHQAGMCPACEGLGIQAGIDEALLVPDPSRSIREGAIIIWDLKGEQDSPLSTLLEGVAAAYGFSLDTPFEDLTREQKNTLLYGAPERWIKTSQGFSYQYRGILPTLEMATRYRHQFREVSELVKDLPCSACQGSRLRPESRVVTLAGQSIADLCARPIGALYGFLSGLELTEQQQEVVGDIFREALTRLRFLLDVGLDYLTLDRRAPTLAGGEAQRIRLASQIGSGLTGVLYVLDEPTIGLHPRDNRRLLQALKNLRDLGNTLIVVEHDRETLESADYLLDFGPGAGQEGGQIMAVGPPQVIAREKNSLTGQYLSKHLQIALPETRRPATARWLTIEGARHNNLKNLTIQIPLGTLTCVTGVSGSGKSSFVNDTLYPALAARLHRARTVPGEFDRMVGQQHLNKVINIDQTPIGFSPRSNPATYVKVFDQIRRLFAELPDAKVRGYTPRRFSFNVPGGRCEACLGNGSQLIEMHFLADVWVTCEVCKGSRYNRETLDVLFKGKSIADVLEISVDEALVHFENIPKIRRILQTLADVGLGYIRLGQSATTLSGGEAQRVKLARELARPATGRTLYILDEPTTGLHFDDVAKLLRVLNRLVDTGNTVVVVEHNMDVIKSADYVIDLGPEGGDKGGFLVAAGKPEELANAEASYTGQILREILNGEKE